MTTAWAHLPNAKHIDAVLADVSARPKVWVVPCTAWGAWGPAWGAAWDAIYTTPRWALWADARDAAWDEIKHIKETATCGAVRNTVWSTVLALITWDDSADLLDQPPDVLRAMIDLADAPVCHQAVLLLPYIVLKSATK